MLGERDQEDKIAGALLDKMLSVDELHRVERVIS